MPAFVAAPRRRNDQLGDSASDGDYDEDLDDVAVAIAVEAVAP